MWKKIGSILTKIIAGSLMLLVLGLGIFMISDIFRSCTKDHSSELYLNKKGIIVKMGQEEGTYGKFHQPTVYHTLLIMDMKDSTAFLEWITTHEKYYNYRVGDTVHFDRIRKDRWFKILKH